MENFNFDLIIKIASVVVAIVVAFFHFKNFILNSKTSFKLDLEIFKLIDNSNPNHEKLKGLIDGKIEVYTMKLLGQLKRNWLHIILSAIMGLIFSYWAYFLCIDGFSWWSIPIGYIAFSSLSFAVQSYSTGSGDRYLNKKSETSYRRSKGR